VPLNLLSNTVEREVRQALGDAALPAKLEPVDGYLW
jgi:hypothetical protein